MIGSRLFSYGCRVLHCDYTTAHVSLERWRIWAVSRATRGSARYLSLVHLCKAFFTVKSWDWHCWFTGRAHCFAKSLSVTVTTFTAPSSRAGQPPACTRITNEVSAIRCQFFDVWVLNDRIISNSPPQLGAFFCCCFLKFNSDFMPSVSPRH